MALNRREKVLSVVSVVVLIGAWILTSPSPVPPTTAPAPRNAVIVNPEQVSHTLATLNKKSALSKADPFVESAQQAPEVTPASPATVVEPTFSLQGIFRDAQGKAAIINNDVRHEGEVIAPGVTLIQILEDGVTINSNGQEIKMGFQP